MEFHYHNYRYLSFYNIYIRYFFIVLIITRFVFPCFRNFKMFSSNQVPFMFSSLNMSTIIVLVNNSTTLTDYSTVVREELLFYSTYKPWQHIDRLQMCQLYEAWCIVVVVVTIYNIYIIHIRVKSLSHLWSIFF